MRLIYNLFMNKMNKKNNKNIIPMSEHKLTKSEEYLKVFLDTYPKDTYKLSQKELSEEAFVSEPTISRFVRKHGFKNYREFAIWFNNEVVEFNKKYKRIAKDDNAISIQNLIYSYKYIFEDMTDKLDFDTLEKLANRINKSKKVVVFGLGSSMRAASEVSFNLSRLGVHAITPTDFHSFIPSIGPADKDTLFIFISNNFENKEIRWSVQRLAGKAKVAIITSKELSRFESNWFDYYIKYSKMNNEFFGIPLSNKQGQWLIIDIIFALVFQKVSPATRANFIKGMKALKEWSRD